MKLLSILATLALASIGVEAAINSTQEYRLKTVVKPGQSKHKQRFNDLYMVGYHTGAGLDDAVMILNKSEGIKGFLNGTNGHSGNINYQNQVFDLGTPGFAWSLVPVANAEFYAGWEPVQVNAGNGSSNPNLASGFWINGTGLQWTNDPHAAPNSPANAFRGWLVCEWWHGVPELFFRVPGNVGAPTPCNCADVYLCPEYI